ncbi:hypothetical protein M2139_001405 [Enterococcus sp. PF1-24]|uniref:DUF4828 domain-containing protein n=1 Tax=unclassified Enterococcus TaxID=2608891 RepID=UPI0024740CC3|nr:MULTISPECIES: DUF4828 domain-containing protein [unclassified Enterococcus]MDH6364456.1 hypothetical protein [Enterococcus sp. PFB1-1]MDH6401521.1 hypothetical protein [Enterococcus sp. PF1-24]
MKKKWPWVLGASIFTGLVGSAALHKTKTKKSEQLNKHYSGEWRFYHANKKTPHSLKVENDLTITLDNRSINANIIELNDERLVFQDGNGYHLILQITNNQKATLYDEADDCTHSLDAI